MNPESFQVWSVGLFLQEAQPWPPLHQDVLGPWDKRNQFWVLLAGKRSTALKRFSQPAKCNCIFQLINRVLCAHKAWAVPRPQLDASTRSAGLQPDSTSPPACRPGHLLSPEVLTVYSGPLNTPPILQALWGTQMTPQTWLKRPGAQQK